MPPTGGPDVFASFTIRMRGNEGRIIKKHAFEFQENRFVND